VGIHWLLRSSCCFLNTNTAITGQLIRKARTLEAEWWQVCREAWVRGQRKMSHALGAFWNLWTVYFFNFPNFWGGAANRGYSGPPVINVYCRNQIPTNTLCWQNMGFLLVGLAVHQYTYCTAAMQCTALTACTSVAVPTWYFFSEVYRLVLGPSRFPFSRYHSHCTKSAARAWSYTTPPTCPHGMVLN